MVTVTPREYDVYPRDTDYLSYLTVAVMVLALMFAGLMQAGEPAAREWENATIKELLLSPVARSALIIGKVLAGFTTTLLVGVLVLALGAALGWTQPTGPYIVTSLLIMVLIALFSTGLGVALGAALRRMQIVTTLSVLVAFAPFFLAKCFT